MSLLIGVSVSLASCSRLSPEARAIVGSYTIPEISIDQPVMELNKDATCLLRAIRPGVITYTVTGRWNVEEDSLIIELDKASLTIDGDSALVGDIPVRSARRIIEHNDFNLLIEQGGVVYSYKKI